MQSETFRQAVSSCAVFDAHTHLVGGQLAAQDFWQIVHYFWFLREMQGAGYPPIDHEMPEAERIRAFLHAYRKTKGTGMHYAVERIFSDLYGLSITDETSVYRAMEAVGDTAARKDWAASVAKKGNIARTVVNREEHRAFAGLDGTCVFAPRIDGRLHEAARRIHCADTMRRPDIAGAEKERLLESIVQSKEKGAWAVMTTLQSFGSRTYGNDGTSFATPDDCVLFLLRGVCQAAQENRMTVQFFLGVEHGYCSLAAPVNRTDRIVNLYGLFEDYACDFDLVVATEVNNMDVVQAAQIFPNVHVGGMWWFNFRPSTYLDAMQKRLEALASSKSYLTISDARCIEWCYGKIALIRKLAGDFFERQVADGMVSYEEALEIAADWFYRVPAVLYGEKTK